MSLMGQMTSWYSPRSLTKSRRALARNACVRRERSSKTSILSTRFLLQVAINTTLQSLASCVRATHDSELTPSLRSPGAVLFCFMAVTSYKWQASFSDKINSDCQLLTAQRVLRQSECGASAMQTMRKAESWWKTMNP